MPLAKFSFACPVSRNKAAIQFYQVLPLHTMWAGVYYHSFCAQLADMNGAKLIFNEFGPNEIFMNLTIIMSGHTTI